MDAWEALERVRTGARIRELRKARGLTGAALAQSIGCSRFLISNIEAGRAAVTDERRSAIADALGVEMAELAS